MVPRNSGSLKSNLRFKMFLIFLLLTAVFWFLTKLSKSYSSEVVFNLEYENLPVEKVFQEQPLSEVKVSIFSSGFNLLKYKLSNRNLNIDLGNLSYKSEFIYYYLPNNHLSSLKSQLGDNVVIERIHKDTIFFDLGQNLRKRIPVRLDADIQFNLGYNFEGGLHLSPDSIELVGPEKVLDTMYFINTEKLVLTEVNSNVNETVKLLISKGKGISVSSVNVLVTAEVDKFTEGSLKVPFKVLNVPEDAILTTFPKEVTIFYKVGLKNYSKISEENLIVVCDYEQSISNNLDYLIPSLQRQSSLISSVRFVPNKIEFLIEQ